MTRGPVFFEIHSVRIGNAIQRLGDACKRHGPDRDCEWCAWQYEDASAWFEWADRRIAEGIDVTAFDLPTFLLFAIWERADA